MDTRTYILSRLEERIKERYEPPTYYPKRRSAYTNFMQRSYGRWAANEFLLYLKQNGCHLTESGERFVKMMDEYSCKGKNSWMFSIAHDVAEDLLDYIYTL